MDKNLIFILIFVLVLIAADKILTVINIKSVEKNFPNVDRLSIEKNPIAKWFYKHTGLFFGSVLFSIISFVLFALAWLGIASTLKLLKVPNAESIAFYILIIYYGIIIANNAFFMLKFNKIIP